MILPYCNRQIALSRITGREDHLGVNQTRHQSYHLVRQCQTLQRESLLTWSLLCPNCGVHLSLMKQQPGKNIVAYQKLEEWAHLYFIGPSCSPHFRRHLTVM